MSSTIPKLHPLPGLTRLAVVYLRNAVNNPKWSKGISDFVAGASVVDKLSDTNIPEDAKTDAAVLAWGSVLHDTPIELTDKERDAARSAFRLAIDEKHVAVNRHSVLLITLLGLE